MAGVHPGGFRAHRGGPKGHSFHLYWIGQEGLRDSILTGQEERKTERGRRERGGEEKERGRRREQGEKGKLLSKSF